MIGEFRHSANARGNFFERSFNFFKAVQFYKIRGLTQPCLAPEDSGGKASTPYFPVEWLCTILSTASVPCPTNRHDSSE